VTKLRDAVERVFIVAHREDITDLRSVLEREGFAVEVVRGPRTEEQLTWSAQMQCFANHANVWRKVSAMRGLVLVCEADFVPVKGFADLPVPFSIAPQTGGGQFAWLYNPGATLYGVDSADNLYGHGNTTVCYLFSPGCGQLLLDFFDREIAKHGGKAYCRWETYLGVYLRWEHGIKNFFVERQYGEHGGQPNPEHALHGRRPWQYWHHADLLAGRLAFLPPYARGSASRFYLWRLISRARGAVRIISLRYLDPRHIDPGQSRWKLCAIALRRLARLLLP
jgi:hypothetical protein